MTRERFTELVEEALRDIPRRFRRAMKNVAVVVEDEPPPALLEELEIEPPDTLFGLYQGTPLTERSWSHGNALPDRISIYQQPIEAECADDDEIRECVAETVIHEFGHYFGLSEEEIEEISTGAASRWTTCRCARGRSSVSIFWSRPGRRSSSRP
jgi:predicted Zn-dependent protease with MMP-like domain